MLAFLEEEESTHRCGHPIEDAFDETQEHRWRGAAYDCFACAAVDRKRDEDMKAVDGAPLYGRSWVAIDREQES